LNIDGIAKAVARVMSPTAPDLETLQILGIFCGLGLFVSLACIDMGGGFSAAGVFGISQFVGPFAG
jgi:hypothetical protein